MHLQIHIQMLLQCKKEKTRYKYSFPFINNSKLINEHSPGEVIMELGVNEYLFKTVDGSIILGT